jgi:hypothetical protein
MEPRVCYNGKHVLDLRQNHQRRSQEFELLRDFVAAYRIAAQSSI